jgi:hypothetical protein
MKSSQTNEVYGMRSYQILTIVGPLLTIYDLIVAASVISISVLFVNIFAIIAMFLFKNKTKFIGIGLILLCIVLFEGVVNFNLLRSRAIEIIIFAAAAVTALRYKTKIIVPPPQ